MTTTIALSEDTRDRLKAYGRKGETYEDIIIRFMDMVSREMYLEEVYKRLAEKDKFVPMDVLE